MDLSILIPARNEEFLQRTIEDVVAKCRGDTEVIAVCDGYWPDPPVKDHKRVNLVHYTQPIGQRAGTNAAARLARGRYLCKLDAHCSIAEGFDVEIVRAGDELGHDVTQIPRMYNLHAFDWICEDGHRRYQGPSGPCECGKSTKREMVWQPRLKRRTDFARFDRTLHFQYWRDFEKRPESQGDIANVLCSVGACWAMRAGRYWELGGLDERHGSWGQMGVEIAMKSWSSGGRQVVNKRTWFSHMFRTQGKGFGFPYPITTEEQDAARSYSRWLWEGGNWPGMRKSLDDVLRLFHPVPDWHEA